MWLTKGAAKTLCCVKLLFVLLPSAYSRVSKIRPRKNFIRPAKLLCH